MVLRLHDYLPSGNGYKVRLLLTQLGVPFQRIEYDITRGETHTPEFLERGQRERARARARDRRGRVSARVRRNPVLGRHGYPVSSRRPSREDACPAMDVLRAVQP
jgi:hypothetical protein